MSDYTGTFPETLWELTVPDAPTNLQGTVGNQQISLTWTAPEYNGGAEITSYRLEWKVSTDTTWTNVDTGNTDTNVIITALTNGTEYDVRVAAVNSEGYGAYSNTIQGTPGLPPGAPTNLVGTPSFTEVYLEWDAPTNDGGLAIFKYNVYQIISGSPVLLTLIDPEETLEYTVTELTESTFYTFLVTAENSAGESIPAASSLTTLTSIPVAYIGATKTGRLNQLAETTDETAYSAANIFAEVSGESLTTALNIAAGTTGETATSAANILAGTTGETLTSALNLYGAGE
jgi:titin